jgi:hypothetical protein
MHVHGIYVIHLQLFIVFIGQGTRGIGGRSIREEWDIRGVFNRNSGKNGMGGGGGGEEHLTREWHTFFEDAIEPRDCWARGQHGTNDECEGCLQV